MLDKWAALESDDVEAVVRGPADEWARLSAASPREAAEQCARCVASGRDVFCATLHSLSPEGAPQLVGRCQPPVFFLKGRPAPLFVYSKRLGFATRLS